jgi:rod shape-determining protein MreC
LSSLEKAWYTFLVLAVLTFLSVAFVGQAPLALSSAVALPHDLPYALSVNLRQTLDSAADRRDFRAEAERLRLRVLALEDTNRRLEDRVDSLRTIVAVREDQSHGVVLSATVTGVDPSPLLARLTLGQGAAGGVAQGMPVTVPEGLVGVVTAVSERSASVRTITDPEARVGVAVRGRGGVGTAAGEPGGLLRVLYDERERVEPGDLVETSSRGGLFPRGIVVGTVVQVKPRDPNSLRTELIVRPAVDLRGLLEVALIEPI